MTALVQKRTPERRCSPRRKVTGPDVIPIEAGGSEVGGLILNLSAGGAALQLLGSLPPAERHPFRWRLPSQEQWTEAEGEVVLVWNE